MDAQLDPSRLARRLHTGDAVILGLGSMIGAGIFAAAGPAAAAAGTGLLLAVVIAGCIAWLNASTMAQLAALYPESGGTYVYGRKRLGPIWGFLAGWGFVVGKLASCTAMALTFAYYAAPDYARPLAVTAVLVLTLINYMGVKKTAQATKILVILVLSSLALVAFAALGGGAVDTARLTGWLDRGGFPGLLQASGLMFFAFAGYARIATLGEEVVEPRTTIPRSILIALGITLAVYLLIIGSAVLTVDIDQLAQSQAPLRLAVESGRFHALAPVVRIGACFASLSVLLSLMAGISRTTFAMASGRDLPHALSAVHPVHKVPHRAELMVGLIVAAVVSFADLRSAIGFSSFAILTYYAIANIAAWTLSKEQRLYPRWMSGLGLIACVTVAFSLPGVSVVGGLILFGLGLGIYFFESSPKNKIIS
ncbi:MAG TPA: amino acid permease [Oligoflexus sp.]|uniref:APC family permease n=1 Tax=Oligoflexus sp. TaxID=1971216 RepID=UPI002D7E369A|nr:amino acid permease [Oligoflexus sp.]HET9240331.1 amino acid permease [Oligoflexus sp.]